MKAKGIFLSIALAALLCLSAVGPASGQAQKDYFIVDLAASYNQATVTKAQSGFVGFDIFAGKMLTGSVCLGLYTGYDITSFQTIDSYTERLAVIPLLLKAKYYFTFTQMFQLSVFGAGGVYRTLPHLSTQPIGSIWNAETNAGFSAGLQFDYWFLLTQGVGFAFEYHFFNTDGGELFSYFSARVSYGVVRF